MSTGNRGYIDEKCVVHKPLQLYTVLRTLRWSVVVGEQDILVIRIPERNGPRCHDVDSNITAVLAGKDQLRPGHRSCFCLLHRACARWWIVL